MSWMWVGRFVIHNMIHELYQPYNLVWSWASIIKGSFTNLPLRYNIIRNKLINCQLAMYLQRKKEASPNYLHIYRLDALNADHYLLSLLPASQPQYLSAFGNHKKYSKWENHSEKHMKFILDCRKKLINATIPPGHLEALDCDQIRNLTGPDIFIIDF